MSAGTGVTHSEFNHSKEASVHYLQFWTLREHDGIVPSYEQKQFPPEQHLERLQLISDRHGTDGAVTIHQDVRLYAAKLAPGQEIIQDLPDGPHAWLHVAEAWSHSMAMVAQGRWGGDQRRTIHPASNRYWRRAVAV